MSVAETLHSRNGRIAGSLFRALSAVEGVVSVTLTGSLRDVADLARISDIDTIVVCRKLTKNLLDQCVRAVGALRGEDLGFPGRSVHVNATLGPLKFDTAQRVVVHLMLYDEEGHRRHVLRSPFTCFDWERSDLRNGPSLRALYPVLGLQPRDFVEARRGLGDYLADLERGVITYRRYDFETGAAREVAAAASLDARLRGEYAFHVMRNLVANACKLLSRENRAFSHEDLVRAWRDRLPGLASWIPFYEEMRAGKESRETEFPPDTVARVGEFVRCFETEFRALWRGCPRLLFVRHAPTPLNDGTFLGQGRDPDIVPDAAPWPEPEAVDRVISSPLSRAVQTAQRLAPGAEVRQDARLSELCYGAAEGLTPSALARKYPDVVAGWKIGTDPRFPGGENTADVLARLLAFIEEHGKKPGTTLVVTHNGVLRCLAGHLFGLPLADWYKLPVPHLVPMEVLCRDGKCYPNFTVPLKAALTDGLVGWKGSAGA